MTVRDVFVSIHPPHLFIPTHPPRPPGEFKTNGIWCQDFPFRRPGAPPDTTRFGLDLRDYLEHLNEFEDEHGVGDGIYPPIGHPKLREAIEDLLRVDFSSAQVYIPLTPFHPPFLLPRISHPLRIPCTGGSHPIRARQAPGP